MRSIVTTLLLAILSPVLLPGQSAFGAEKLITAPASDPATSPQQPAASQPTFEDIRPIGQPISLGVSSGTLLHVSSAVQTVFVADADVADVQIRAADFIYIVGKKPGQTVLYAQDDAGHVLLKTAITVGGLAAREPVTIIRRAEISIGGQPGPAAPPGTVSETLTSTTQTGATLTSKSSTSTRSQ